MTIVVRPFEAENSASFLEPVGELFANNDDGYGSSDVSEVDLSHLADKVQLQSVLRLAAEHGARRVVWETEYVDRHYLEDYVGYYSRCFSRYRRRCARAHFLKTEMEEEALIDLLVRDDERALNKVGYIGYCVIKPLPHTVVGRTAMPAPILPDATFPIRENFSALLGGHEFSIECALFQEQDKEVAACATVALWCALSATARKFNHSTLSPFEITKKANEAHNFTKRTLPNSGLNHYQMSAAIKSAGLDWVYYDFLSGRPGNRAAGSKVNAEGGARSADKHAEPHAPGRGKDGAAEPALQTAAATSAKNADLRDSDADEIDRQRLIDTEAAKGVIYAFLRSGIPPILTLQYGAPNYQPGPTSRHAVALVGYELDPTVPLQSKVIEGAPRFVSNRLSKLYAHDDNNGPYTEVEFIEDYVYVKGHKPESGYVSQLLIPVYHKIRTPLEDIIDFVRSADNVNAVKNEVTGTNTEIEWDLYLSTLKSVRQDASKTNCLHADKKAIICENAPRYLWVVSALSRGARLFDVLLDATDLKQGGAVVGVLRHDLGYAKEIQSFESDKAFIKDLPHRSASKFFRSLIADRI